MTDDTRPGDRYINTGKVLIGSAWTPPPPRSDPHAESIQAALLNARRESFAGPRIAAAIFICALLWALSMSF